MADSLITALIAGTVALSVSLIGYLAAVMKIRQEQKKFEKELATRYANKIYEERLKLYPRAYAITSHLRRVKAPDYLPPPETLERIKKDLNIWVTEAGLFLSRDSAKAYWELRNALNKRPGSGNKYSKEQGDKVWHLRNELRSCLRTDIGNIYTEDTNTETSEYWEHI